MVITGKPPPPAGPPPQPGHTVAVPQQLNKSGDQGQEVSLWPMSEEMRRVEEESRVEGLHGVPLSQRSEEGQHDVRLAQRSDSEAGSAAASPVMIVLFIVLARNKLRIPLEGTYSGEM